MILKELATLSENDRKLVNLTPPLQLFEAKGCKKCGNTGTKGRLAIYEILAMAPQLEKAILSDPTEQVLREEARRQGMLTMKQDGFLKALQGFVSLEEVLQTVETDVEEQVVK